MKTDFSTLNNKEDIDKWYNSTIEEINQWETTQIEKTDLAFEQWLNELQNIDSIIVTFIHKTQNITETAQANKNKTGILIQNNNLFHMTQGKVNPIVISAQSTTNIIALLGTTTHTLTLERFKTIVPELTAVSNIGIVEFIGAFLKNAANAYRHFLAKQSPSASSMVTLDLFTIISNPDSSYNDIFSALNKLIINKKFKSQLTKWSDNITLEGIAVMLQFLYPHPTPKNHFLAAIHNFYPGAAEMANNSLVNGLLWFNNLRDLRETIFYIIAPKCIAALNDHNNQMKELAQLKKSHIKINKTNLEMVKMIRQLETAIDDNNSNNNECENTNVDDIKNAYQRDDLEEARTLNEKLIIANAKIAQLEAEIAQLKGTPAQNTLEKDELVTIPLSDSKTTPSLSDIKNLFLQHFKDVTNSTGINAIKLKLENNTYNDSDVLTDDLIKIASERKNITTSLWTFFGLTAGRHEKVTKFYDTFTQGGNAMETLNAYLETIQGPSSTTALTPSSE